MDVPSTRRRVILEAAGGHIPPTGEPMARRLDYLAAIAAGVAVAFAGATCAATHDNKPGTGGTGGTTSDMPTSTTSTSATGGHGGGVGFDASMDGNGGDCDPSCMAAGGTCTN